MLRKIEMDAHLTAAIEAVMSALRAHCSGWTLRYEVTQLSLIVTANRVMLEPLPQDAQRLRPYLQEYDLSFSIESLLRQDIQQIKEMIAVVFQKALP
jgi:hypothetical protein